jgi:hypothetical protein
MFLLRVYATGCRASAERVDARLHTNATMMQRKYHNISRGMLQLTLSTLQSLPCQMHLHAP